MIKLDRLPMLCLVGVISFSLLNSLDTISFLSSLADAVSHFEKDHSHLIDNKMKNTFPRFNWLPVDHEKKGDDDAST